MKINLFKKSILFLLLLVCAGMVFASPAMADLGSVIKGKLGTVQDKAGLPAQSSPVDVVVLVIKGALGLLVIIFFIMILVAGFRWMTAGGNEDTVGKAKSNIKNAVIGLVVVLFAYAITNFIFDVIFNTAA